MAAFSSHAWVETTYVADTLYTQVRMVRSCRLNYGTSPYFFVIVEEVLSRPPPGLLVDRPKRIRVVTRDLCINGFGAVGRGDNGGSGCAVLACGGVYALLLFSCPRHLVVIDRARACSTVGCVSCLLYAGRYYLCRRRGRKAITLQRTIPENGFASSFWPTLKQNPKNMDMIPRW